MNRIDWDALDEIARGEALARPAQSRADELRRGAMERLDPFGRLVDGRFQCRVECRLRSSELRFIDLDRLQRAAVVFRAEFQQCRITALAHRCDDLFDTATQFVSA